MKKSYILLASAALLPFILGSCGKNAQDTASLAVGLMPAVDSAPILLAAERGYFEEEGTEVSLEIYTNAQNRQSALQSGQIDGAITDLVALSTNAAADFDTKATTLTCGMFAVLANKQSLEQKQVSVGTMEISVTNYLLDHWLDPQYTMKKTYINEIPLRLEAVAGGKLDMGIFPEPIASIGAAKGLEKLTFPPPGGNWPDALIFTQKAREEKREAVQAFHRAYNRAIRDIRSDEGLAREILVAKIPQLKPALKEALSLPEYRTSYLPDDAYLRQIIQWTDNMIDTPLQLAPEDIIDRSFVQ